MSMDEEKIKNIKTNLSEFDLRGLNLADFSSQEEIQFHNYIKGICQRLLGDTLNLDEKNIIFALSDKNGINAAHVSKGNVSIIFLTEKLLDLCDNEDQLAFILGHELGHYEETLHQGSDKINSKAEETACDLRAIQKMARGGYNLEEACNMAAKLFNNPYISIEDLKDPHTNDSSRLNLINAMKKKEKDRIIEEQNIEITHSTPISQDILKIVHERPKKQPFSETLFSQMEQAAQKSDDKDEAKIDVWLKTFHEHIVPNGNSYSITQDDMRALGAALNRNFVNSDKFADKFLAAVFTDMQSMPKDAFYNAYTNIMQATLEQIYSFDTDYCHSKVFADENDSKTAAWLRYYLHGFREAEGENFDNVINNLEFVKKFVAQHNWGWEDGYKGILVKDFNLLELDFNENDVGKKISPQILKYIQSNINSSNEFVSFSGLSAHKMGDALLLTHGKNNWSVFADTSGKITYSFSAQDLNKTQAILMKNNIESAQANLEDVVAGKITDTRQRLDILKKAYQIVSPVSKKNDLDCILEIRGSTDDEKDVLYDELLNILSDKAKSFFYERIAQTNDNLPYTQKITDLYADAIRSAPKEYFNEILETLTIGRIHNRLMGEDKLMRAFLDNPAFNEELSTMVKSYEPFPSQSNEWDLVNMFSFPDAHLRANLSNFVSRIKEITDLKLGEHLEHGGSFDNFEQPFQKDLAQLFSFSPYGDIDEKTALENLKRTRNKDNFYATLYEQAYIAYSSFDALKTNASSDIELLLGFNAAGTDLKKQHYRGEQILKSAERYHIDASEQKQITERLQSLQSVTDKIHNRLTERINHEIENGNISIRDICNMTERNDYQDYGVHGQHGFNTLISNFDFEKQILHYIENGDIYDIHSGISSLSLLIKAYEHNTKESDTYKEKIWPSVAKIFERNDLDIIDKTKFFRELVYEDVFASDYKRYYEVLIGKNGKSGLLNTIDKLENQNEKSFCYDMLLERHTRIPDPEIRSDVIKKAALACWQVNGKYNDITNSSEEQKALIIKEVRSIKESIKIAELDKIEFLKELSELTFSQKELSLIMKPESMELQASDSDAIAAAYGLDAVAYALQHYPDTRANVQDFLLGEGLPEEATNLVKSIHIAMCKEHDKYKSPKILDRYLSGEDILDDLGPYEQLYFNKLNPQICIHFKKEFDAAPLEVKALIINEIITNGRASWEETFKIVSGKLFADAGELGKVGSDFLHSYIAARPNSEKNFYLAAMMAAANNKSKSAQNYTNSPYSIEERNLAKGLRLFLENSGPAGTKLAQAMASYNAVPEFIRYEMQFAKSEANPPARWDIFSGNYETMDKLLSYGALGKRRGSASFFVTYDLGDKIVKIMRRGAKLKADSEFAIYSEMLQTLSAEYQNISSFKRLVQNAAENVHIETDLNIGEQQYLDAKQLYPDKVTADNITFDIKVMDWVAKGTDWAIMDKAQGVDFKELDEPYKTAVAKAVFSTELSNMLSGKRFDSDRHGGQYKFDTNNNVIGVFDTGSMSMTEPTDKERYALGIVLARTLKGIRRNPDVASVFNAEIDNAVQELYKSEIAQNKPIPPYLSEFQRGMLALNDFYAPLSGKDMAECMIKAFDNGKNHIHPQIVNSFKLEIKKSLDKHNVSVQELLNPEKTDNLQPEARANRRVGKILFDAVFQSISEGKNIDTSSEAAQKLISRLKNNDADLQIVKGVVRGAYDKLNPKNYTQKDREELGSFLYKVCRLDAKNQKLKKGEALENIIAEVSAQTPQMGEYTQNVMKLVSLMAKISDLNDDKLKKAAAFVAFYDHDVARGFKKSLKEDKNISFAKRIMFRLTPMDFIPRNAKKILIKAINKHVVSDYISKKLFGNTTVLTPNYQNSSFQK